MQSPMHRLQNELSKLRANLGATGVILHKHQLLLSGTGNYYTRLDITGCLVDCVNEQGQAGSYRGQWDRPSAHPAQTAVP